MSASNTPHTSNEPPAMHHGRSPQLSSEGLSSPPRSSPEVASPSTLLTNGTSSTPTSILSAGNNTSVPGVILPGATVPKPPRRKAVRKSKDPTTAAVAGAETPKAKRVRKPKDPNAPPAQRRKKNPPNTTAAPDVKPRPVDSKPKVTTSRQPLPSPDFTLASHVLPTQILPSQNGNGVQSFFNAGPLPTHSVPPPPPNPLPAPSVRTSGQNYDPIRSSNYDPVRETVTNHHPRHNPQKSPMPTHTISYPSASPLLPGFADVQGSQPHTPPSLVPSPFVNSQQPRILQSDTNSIPVSQILNQHVPSSIPDTSNPSKPPTPVPAIKSTEAVTLTLLPSIPSKRSTASSTGSQKNTKSKETLKVKDGKETSKPKEPKEAKVKEAKVKEPKEPKIKEHKEAKVKEPRDTSKTKEPKETSKAKEVRETAKAKEIRDTAKAKEARETTKAKDTKDSNDVSYPIPPPLPGTGNGPNDGTEYRAPTVIIHIPMNGEVNKYVNFTRLAEQQYGWDALHPRLAAQRDRLARVAAAGAALERSGSNRDSGDEMSLDSEAEGSNGEAGAGSDGRAGGNYDTKKVPKKRKMKEDEYDKDDGFVDDTELLWEEQAAASNDGFFVYSGPLIPEGEKPSLDSKNEGSNKRGRGRGPRGGNSRTANSRGAATTTTTTTTASSIASTAANTPATGMAATNTTASGRNNLPTSGPGSRGGAGVRKPRITKAERLRLEQEKVDLEKAALATE